MPSWFRPRSDPYYPVSEAEAPTHWIPKSTDAVMLIVIAALIALAAIAGQRSRSNDAPPTTTTQTQGITDQ